MNKSILELLEEVSGTDLLFTLFLIIAIGVLIITQKEKIMKHLNKWRCSKNEDEDFHALVYELKNSIETLSSEVKHNQETMNVQSESIAELKDIVIKMQEKNSETKRAEIKEKIERIYRECTGDQVCTEMQLESLKGLIEQYEKHGGDNSFVHTIVQPEMYKWEVVTGVRRVNRVNREWESDN